MQVKCKGEKGVNALRAVNFLQKKNTLINPSAKQPLTPLPPVPFISDRNALYPASPPSPAVTRYPFLPWGRALGRPSVSSAGRRSAGRASPASSASMRHVVSSLCAVRGRGRSADGAGGRAARAVRTAADGAARLARRRSMKRRTNGPRFRRFGRRGAPRRGESGGAHTDSLGCEAAPLGWCLRVDGSGAGPDEFRRWGWRWGCCGAVSGGDGCEWSSRR